MSLPFLNGDWPLGFTHPWILLLWLLYPLCLRFCRRHETVRNFGNLAMLKNTAGRRIDPVPWLGGLALLLILASLADPYGIRSEQKRVIQGREIALLLDASNSMSDEKRFDEARKILSDFIRSRRGDRLALEVFGDRAALASAATEDRSALLRLLDALHPGVVGGRETALYEALFRAPELFEEKYRGPKVAILLTDGIDT
ncbi:vWA domain-containing protein, partial [Nitratifractor sp.]